MRIVLLFKFCGYQAFYKQQTIRVFEKHFLLLLLLLNLQLSFSNVNTWGTNWELQTKYNSQR